MEYAQEMETGQYYPQDGLTVKEKIQYSLLGIIVVGGAVIIGRNWIRKAQANHEELKTLDEGNAPTIAKQIKMAFENDGWFGTDKDTLRLAIRSIPSRAEFRKVMVSYQKLYGSSLLGDMQKELKSSEYNEMLYIVSAKPETYHASEQQQLTSADLQGWAKRLNAAFNISYGPFPGTDEPAIKAVFLEIPTQAVFTQVAAVYQSLFGSDLMEDLKSELELWEYDPMMQIINSKPKN
ncbi:MAG: hypothetical protein JSS82_13290 [Bacteroidetes bacterium]|nr:hypothetical protein [Bacteroidota bacterium]